MLPRPQFTEVLKNRTVLLLPDYVGGFLAVTEVMSANCLCVVAEENLHLRGLIKHSEAGLTFLLARPTEVIKQIVKHLEAPSRLWAIGENARPYLLQNCLWPQVVNKMWGEVENRFGPR